MLTLNQLLNFEEKTEDGTTHRLSIKTSNFGDKNTDYEISGLMPVKIDIKAKMDIHGIKFNLMDLLHKYAKEKHGSRYIQIGIAEQNGIGVAAGVAQFGKIPIFQSLSVFLTGRPYDQIRESICYSELNVKIVGYHAGLTLAPDGATHQTMEDIALMTSLPNMSVVAPADA